MSEPIKRELWIVKGSIAIEVKGSITDEDGEKIVKSVQVTPLAKNTQDKAKSAAEEWVKEKVKGETRTYEIEQIYPVK